MLNLLKVVRHENRTSVQDIVIDSKRRDRSDGGYTITQTILRKEKMIASALLECGHWVEHTGSKGFTKAAKLSCPDCSKLILKTIPNDGNGFFEGLTIRSSHILKANGLLTKESILDAIHDGRLAKMNECGKKTYTEIVSWVYLK